MNVVLLILKDGIIDLKQYLVGVNSMLKLKLGRMNFDITGSDIGGAQVHRSAGIRLLPDLCRSIEIEFHAVDDLK